MLNDNLKKKVIENDVKNLEIPLIWSGDLIIEGNVSNAKIQAQGNVIAMGNCEGSSIESTHGSIFMLYGASQKNSITAKKNIYLKYCTDSELFASNDIIIENHILNSTLNAENSIISESKGGKIIGGKAYSENFISIDSIGNENLETIIEIKNVKGYLKCNKLSSKVFVRIGGHNMKNREMINCGKIYIINGSFYSTNNENGKQVAL